MNNKKEDLIEQVNLESQNFWLSRLLPITLSLSIAVSSWFLSQAWDKIIKLEERVQGIELSAASKDGNRFTNNDWVSAKAILDTERTNMDRRLVRLEESIPVIKDSLLEIRVSLNKKNNNE